MRILIASAFGWTASSIVTALKTAGHEITGFDQQNAVCPLDVEGLFHTVFLGDVAVFNDVHRATRDIDAIVHLAVATGADDYVAPSIPIRVNVQGTYNVFDSARRRGIEKIVLMSSASVHLPHAEGEKLDASTDWRSDSGDDHLHDLTNRLQEEIAKDFCETYQMNTVVLRAGHIVDGRMGVDPQGRPLDSLHYCQGGWVCRYDLAAACVQTLKHDMPGYQAYHIIGSSEARRRFDVDRTAKELGLVFESRFERYIHDVDSASGGVDLHART